MIASLYDAGVTIGELNVLVLLQRGYLRADQIADYFCCTRETVAGVLCRLRRKQLITGKSGQLALSESGAQALRSVREFLSSTRSA